MIEGVYLRSTALPLPAAQGDANHISRWVSAHLRKYFCPSVASHYVRENRLGPGPGSQTGTTVARQHQRKPRAPTAKRQHTVCRDGLL